MIYSIIIPTHNRPLALKSCLEKISPLLNSTLNLVIILDGSGEDVYKILNEYKNLKNLHLIKGDGNLFWGGAIAKGMEYSFNELNSDRVIWLNDDTEFKIEDVSLFISYEYNHSEIVGARLYGENVERNIYNISSNNGVVPVSYLNGNFTSIPKNIFFKIGNINYQKFPHFADAPYLEKAKKCGFLLKCNTDITVNIEYDVLRHLPLWQQVILRPKRKQFIKWSLLDIRSKWFIPYRFNYSLNKFGMWGYLVFPLIFLKNWLPVAFFLLMVSINPKIQLSLLKNIKKRKQLTQVEFDSLKKEVESL
ncbi:glycosyltransferase family 2 protein [Providencia sp. R33]|uniref:glycosyltransferase family 2 protein n=1 Tax=Providencia sp. R33 TaxID=2828763 RepID=UPI001C5B804B|nr:glycosyltransferase family 2 protein [Providencia sp. R33]